MIMVDQIIYQPQHGLSSFPVTSYWFLEKACSRWGMKINPSKCKIMSQDERHITLNDALIDKVDDFVFLGSNVPSVVADVKRRTRLAAWEFGRLKNAIWTNQDITRSLKVRIYRALILPGHYAKLTNANWTPLKWDAYE